MIKQVEGLLCTHFLLIKYIYVCKCKLVGVHPRNPTIREFFSLLSLLISVWKPSCHIPDVNKIGNELH